MALFLFGAILLIALFSALGLFDPAQPGETVWKKELTPIRIRPESADQRWLIEELPSSPLSVRLIAGYDSGDLDSAYGLLFGQGDDSIAVMISPLGNVAVASHTAPEMSGAGGHYLPWQTWPHVRTGSQTNDLLVNLEDDTINIRLNGEFLWERNGIKPVNRIGLIGASYGEEVTIDYRLAEISKAKTAE